MHSPFCNKWGVEPPTIFSKRGSLAGHYLLEGVGEKEGMTFFRGEGGNFYVKIKLKSEIYLMTKNITKNVFLPHN